MNKEFKDVVMSIQGHYNISTGEIAERLGVTRQYLSRVISGVSPFNEALRSRVMEEFPEADNEESLVEHEIMKFMRANTYTVSDLAKKLGVPTTRVIGTIADGFNEDSAKLWSDTFGFNKNFLLSGKGEVMKTDYRIVPLIPVSAQAGRLADFACSVSEYECDKILSPVKEAELAIPITGESMYPEFPSGSIVFVKKINEKSFIEWGKPYVLDTVNGAVVKYLAPGSGDSIKCISANPSNLYAPFEIPTADIFGVYRIVNMLCMK